MGNTLTVRLPEDLFEQLRKRSRNTGLPVARIVRQALETTLAKDQPAANNQAWRKFSGIIKGGPRDVSTRKGFSHG
jgi:Ribbon-helix-helix domain